ncbi:MAG: hypothetical protein EA409_05370 [Saprospirales bacterium]|nr:MAG: hypothetical protein EA409_05370 [Saprospirales bacterium]
MLSLPGIFRTDFPKVKGAYWAYWLMVVLYFITCLIVYLLVDIFNLHEIGMMILGIVFILLLPLIIATHSVYLTYRLWDLSEKRMEATTIADDGTPV